MGEVSSIRRWHAAKAGGSLAAAHCTPLRRCPARRGRRADRSGRRRRDCVPCAVPPLGRRRRGLAMMRRAQHTEAVAAGGEQRRVPWRLRCRRRWLGRAHPAWVRLARGSLVRRGSCLAHVSPPCTPRYLSDVGVVGRVFPRACCSCSSCSPISTAAGTRFALPR